MSCSLLLSPRLSPAVLFGVSHGTAETAGASRDFRVAISAQFGHHFLVVPHDFPMKLSTDSGTQLANGAHSQSEEKPITAA